MSTGNDAAPSYKRKLIEVALPLEDINREAAREKSIRYGHPSTLHLWWARRPLAAVRAVLFAQLVDDPSAHSDRFPTTEAQQAERERLFAIIRELVKWENSTNETVLAAARKEIWDSCGRQPACRSSTRSPAADRSRWKLSDSAWRRTPATSIPSPS